MSMQTNPHTSTSASLFPKTRVFVVYAADTGEVLHLHRAVSFGLLVEDSEPQAARALRHAGGKRKQPMQVLEVDGADIDRRTSFKVDVKKKSLTDIEPSPESVKKTKTARRGER